MNKGNYSGLIIFSDKDRDVLKIEHYKKGKIVRGSILKRDEIHNMDSISYLTIYGSAQILPMTVYTRSLDDTLSPIVVVGTVPGDREGETYGGNEDGGSSGGAYGEGSGYDDEGGGNSSGDPLNCVVSINISGPGTAIGAGVYTKSTNVVLTANSSENYIFGGWIENLTEISLDESFSFTIERDHNFTAYFFSNDSECGKLAKKYKGNADLNSGFELLDEKRLTDNDIEHGVFKTDCVINDYVKGRESSICIPTDKGVYHYFIHSHPNDVLIPSIEDIYGIYCLYERNLFTSESILFIQTYLGCLGLEIEDYGLLDNFFKTKVFYNQMPSDKAFALFNEKFDRYILGNPGTEISEYEYSLKAIQYYSQVGIKMARSEKDINGKNINWAYAKVEDGVVTYKDCIQIN